MDFSSRKRARSLLCTYRRHHHHSLIHVGAFPTRATKRISLDAAIPSLPLLEMSTSATIDQTDLSRGRKVVRYKLRTWQVTRTLGIGRAHLEGT